MLEHSASKDADRGRGLSRAVTHLHPRRMEHDPPDLGDRRAAPSATVSRNDGLGRGSGGASIGAASIGPCRSYCWCGGNRQRIIGRGVWT